MAEVVVVDVETTGKEFNKGHQIVEVSGVIYETDFDEVIIVYLLPFDEIPEQGKRYITIRSARIFHDRTLGANTLHKFSAEDEKHALTILKQAESSTGDYTIFDTPEQAYTISRNNRVF